MIKLNKKGEAETIGYTSIIFIIVIIVGVITAATTTIIAQQQSVTRFENSKNYISSIDAMINQLMLSPVGSGDKISLDLTNLYLNVISDENKIEIYHLINGNYYDNNKLIYQGLKYTYRDKQKLYAGIQYTDVNITTDLFVQNKVVLLYFEKTGINQLRITMAANTDE